MDANLIEALNASYPCNPAIKYGMRSDRSCSMEEYKLALARLRKMRP